MAKTLINNLLVNIQMQKNHINLFFPSFGCHQNRGFCLIICHVSFINSVCEISNCGELVSWWWLLPATAAVVCRRSASGRLIHNWQLQLATASQSHSESGCCQQGINAKKGNTSSFSVTVLSYFIFFQWPRRGLFSPKIRTSQNANLTKKECSNQKVEENKPALKFNFTQEYFCPGTFWNNFDSQRALVGLAEIGQNGPKSQKRSRTVVFLCKIEF